MPDAFEVAEEKKAKEVDEKPAPRAEKRQKRSGLGQRWCDALNTDEVEPGEDGELPALQNTELVQRLNSMVDQLEKSNHQEKRREKMRQDLELLHGERIEDLDSSTLILGGPDDDALSGQIFHASYSVLSTIKNRIISFRPRAQFLPTGGNGKAKRASRNMTSLSDAWADAIDLHAEMAMAYDDKLSCDISAIQIYVEDGKTQADRVPPWELMVEEGDGKNMRPECIYRVRHIPAAQVAAQLGVEVGEVIDGDGFDTRPGSFGADGGRTEAKVRVVDAYQCATGKRKGRHVIVCGKRLELDDDWEYEDAPFVVDRFDKRRIGWPGSSAMSKIRSAQEELNDQQVTLREAHYNSATKVIQYQEADEAPTGFNNDYVALVPFRTTPAVISTPPAINAEAYTYINTIKAQMYETLGTSQQAAQGQSRPGVTAAVAIREDTELQTDRLAEESQKHERQRVDIAKWWWRLTRDYARKHPEAKPSWKAINRGTWKEMVFEDIEGEYEIRVFPSSLFGQSLPGRFQRANDLIKEGWLEREDAMAALDVPDISPVVDQALAEKYYMEKIVDDILEDEHYETPDDFVPAAKIFEYARRRYLLVLSEGGEEAGYSKTSLDQMRRLLNATKPKPALPAMPPMIPDGSGGMPLALPPPLPGVAPATSAGPTPQGEPPMMPPGAGEFPPTGLPPVEPVMPAVMQ